MLFNETYNLSFFILEFFERKDKPKTQQQDNSL